MARLKSNAPTHRKHGPSNTARCWVVDRWVSSGKYGSPEGREAFARIVAEHAASATPVVAVTNSTVEQILLPYWRHAEKHYRHPDGTPTNELNEIKRSLAPLRGVAQNAGQPARRPGQACVQVGGRRGVGAGGGVPGAAHPAGAAEGARRRPGGRASGPGRIRPTWPPRWPTWTRTSARWSSCSG